MQTHALASNTAQALIESLDRSIQFIENLMHQRDNGKKKRKSNRNALHHKDKQKRRHNHPPIDIKTINLHLKACARPLFITNQTSPSTTACEYSKLIDPNKKTSLYLEWKNDFSLTEETENHLLNWVVQQFPFTKYGFSDRKDHDIKLYLKSHSQHKDARALNLRSDITNKSIFDYDSNLMAKTLSKFYNFRLRHWCLMSNKTHNMFFRDSKAKQWWNEQLQDMQQINANEWFDKCVEWKIMPSKLLKDYIATKRLFISHYTTSVQVDKCLIHFLNYYDDKSDFTDEDYFKPLDEFQRDADPNYKKDPVQQALKAKRNKGYVYINDFLLDIGKIPHGFGGYDAFMKGADEATKQKQYNLYMKWVEYARRTHRRKWMRYLKRKIESDAIEPLTEYETQDDDDYRIPNIDKLLTVRVCEEMCQILLMDGMLGINNMVKSHSHASVFEGFAFDAIKCLFCERKDGVMMNEKDVRRSECGTVTPDVLFSSSVNINGVDIYWMDMKHYYVTSKEPITFRSIGEQMANYSKSFGNGAIVCCGFQSNFVHKLRQRYPQITATILMLDASKWYHFAKKQRY